MLPAIVALHYWAGSGREFELLRPLLPPGQALLAPDLPGFGGQAAPAGFDYSVGSYVAWLMGYIAEHKLPHFLLLGHSMGGKIALAAAHSLPGLRGLLLLSPSPPGPEPMTDADRAASLTACGQPAAAAKTLARITAAPLTAADRASIIQDNLRTTPAAWVAWLTGGSREDLTALMPPGVPCRLLVGTADQAIPPATQRQHTLPRLPAGTQFEEVPGAGHLLPLEAPARVAAALADLTQSVVSC
ncbi:alpha/beta fold hydrolase [uncultured Hymenobacter sp.]|uniref:alpha/beta fold hydrolase n=1 Tax=uncultured Hymenobacter sp. TaxID=170016 RepID=UPI0035CAD3B0